ncbi:ABC transporter ATP-binding protein [Mesorhizobium sp. M1E.F.Ca.ET.045.02.1.1]|uniref:ABC transporter ATP-binding protein n=1 Tax=Mesorhizobium sp. M1E.F.Ca.ET.045.02.1.1 TaxID=2493672 RepID=UPI000F761198|nr:ABC transporter ATP-binding protein [Mesorhizobium sp. M1E.F.Ca.ET.045.02.1.1]AZO25101.1 ABC transporter ATP-binding protein [Mesorhizobium sp. M1E.F.Ca.ET.045.02.1.1]TKB17953.1 MAG: ABC transporter ATP-binding protein [Mesorhizobium sp.]
MTSGDVAIRLQDVTKVYRIYTHPKDRLIQMVTLGRVRRFREYPAIHGVSFEVLRGETIGIIGRNGSGKSTLLQMIGGGLYPTSGTIDQKGKLYSLQLGTGFNPEFTGRENAYLGAEIIGMSKSEANARMDSILDFAGIGDFIDQPVKTYSSGMYARLAFAVAAHLPADILLVDEVLAVGDLAFSQKCMRFIHEFKSRGTLLLCAHDLGSVMALCSRVVWIDGGKVRMIGPTKEVCDEYRRAIELEGDSTAELKFGGRRGERPLESPPPPDHRAEMLRSSALTNDIQVFDFDDDAAWIGARSGSIVSAGLKSATGSPVVNLSGGENVVFEVKAKAHVDLEHPIVGFSVRDRHGQVVFADNTFLTYRHDGVVARASEAIIARFAFQMPYLPTGDYGITVALATGSQAEHIKQHRVDDAIFFHVVSSHVAKGLVGIPMQSITLEAFDEGRQEFSA